MKHWHRTLLVMLLSGLPWAARAETLVSVDVRIDWDLIIQSYGRENVRSVETDAADKIATTLASTYPHWMFARTVPGQAGMVTLVVDVPQPNTVGLILKTSEPVTEWKADWLKPGDLQAGRAPALEQMTDALVTVFKKEILAKYGQSNDGQSIGDWLKKHVPVAMNGIWHPSQGAELRIVFPLPFERHKKLRDATLRVEGRSSEHLLQTLTVTALGEQSPYPPGQAAADYQAVQGQATKRQLSDDAPQPVDGSMAPELRALTLEAVFLDKARHHALDVATDSRDGQ